MKWFRRFLIWISFKSKRPTRQKFTKGNGTWTVEDKALYIKVRMTGTGGDKDD